MNNIISVKIEREESSYKVTIEHLDEQMYPIMTELDFEDIYKAFEYLGNIKTN
jgi:hypothetical protein